MQNFNDWLEEQFEETPLPPAKFTTKVMQKIPPKRPWLWVLQAIIWLGGLSLLSKQTINLDLQLSGLHLASLAFAAVLIILTTNWVPGFSLNSQPVFPRANK